MEQVEGSPPVLTCVSQQDQIDGTGMSLGSRKGVRVTGRHAPPPNWGNKAGGPSIIHLPPSAAASSETPTVISIGPRPHRPPEEEDWPREASPEARVSYCQRAVPRQTMEELKTILRESPLLGVRGREEGKPGGPYTYLHAGGGPGDRQNDGNSHRLFSTFKPVCDASRRGAGSIQPPGSVDASSSFRADANTERQPGVRAPPSESHGSWAQTAAPHTGRCRVTLSFTLTHLEILMFINFKLYITIRFICL